ncbi:MAG: hypothetical protein M1422_04315 [Candidatus Thermoplasmatota archaeon]|jgi:hypothetical protein|nr:hypothetical protein [Candidatus Thermoplasmatota archaeon]MCL5254046.1 hypothetical protein [Candidatus Thermoplasmatota archaeon]
MTSKYRLALSIKCGTDAEKVNRIISPDNDGYITSRAVGESIEAEADADDLNSLLRTGDDFIVCVDIAIRALKKNSDP